jgi:hypothetical protein
MPLDLLDAFRPPDCDLGGRHSSGKLRRRANADSSCGLCRWAGVGWRSVDITTDSRRLQLCSQAPEFIDHLFMCCVFSSEVWYKVLRHCGLEHLSPAAPDRLVEWWLASRKRVLKPRHRAFDSMVFAVAWSIWLERNDRVFNRVSSDPSATAGSTWNLLSLWVRARLVDWSRLIGE